MIEWKVECKLLNWKVAGSWDNKEDAVAQYQQATNPDKRIVRVEDDERTVMKSTQTDEN